MITFIFKSFRKGRSMDYLEKIKTIISLLDELDKDYAEFPDKQSEIDSKISDIYHYIESSTLTSKNSYRVTKELKECLIQRRELKKKHSVLQVFENSKNKLLLDKNRQMLLADVFKEEKNYSKKYIYRIYDEEEFIKQMEK